MAAYDFIGTADGKVYFEGQRGNVISGGENSPKDPPTGVPIDSRFYCSLAAWPLSPAYKRLAGQCPCCGETGREADGHPTFARCTTCGALIGTDVPSVIAYARVQGRWSPNADSEEIVSRQRYYDMTVVGQDGHSHRRHGWYDPTTGLLTQVG